MALIMNAKNAFLKNKNNHLKIEKIDLKKAMAILKEEKQKEK